MHHPKSCVLVPSKRKCLGTISLCLANPITLYNEMTASVNEERVVEVVCLDLILSLQPVKYTFRLAAK